MVQASPFQQPHLPSNADIWSEVDAKPVLIAIGAGWKRRAQSSIFSDFIDIV
jgi:hypothetical protein